MKQVQPNPWDKVAERYPPGTQRQGHGPQPDQLRRLHRDRGRHRRPAARQRHELDPQGRPSQRGGRQGREGQVPRARRSIRSARASPWASSRWRTIRGKATSRAGTSPARSSRARSPSSPTSASSSSWRPGLEGLLHISELADHKVESPEDVVKVGDEIEVKVLRVDAADRKIGLSRKRVEWAEEAEGRGAGGRRASTRAGRTVDRRKRAARAAWATAAAR